MRGPLRQESASPTHTQREFQQLPPPILNTNTTTLLYATTVSLLSLCVLLSSPVTNPFFILTRERRTWRWVICGVHVSFSIYLPFFSFTAGYCLCWHLTLDAWQTFFFYLTFCLLYCEQASPCDCFSIFNWCTCISKITSDIELKWSMNFKCNKTLGVSILNYQ